MRNGHCSKTPRLGWCAFFFATALHCGGIWSSVKMNVIVKLLNNVKWIFHYFSTVFALFVTVFVRYFSGMSALFRGRVSLFASLLCSRIFTLILFNSTTFFSLTRCPPPKRQTLDELESANCWMSFFLLEWKFLRFCHSYLTKNAVKHFKRMRKTF